MLSCNRSNRSPHGVGDGRRNRGRQTCFEVLDREDDVNGFAERDRHNGTKGAIALQEYYLRLRARSTMSFTTSICHYFVEPNYRARRVNRRRQSTLLSLVPRFYDPEVRSFTLDGRDFAHITKTCAPNRHRARRHAPVLYDVREKTVCLRRPGATALKN